MAIPASVIRYYSKGKGAAANIASVDAALEAYGRAYGLLAPHRLAHFLAQLAHESGGFRFDRELWGPTPAQARYDTRTDLGNTPARDGDGEKFKGRTELQLTGRANYVRYRDWCRSKGYNPPDFEATPEAVNTDPWEGLAGIWFWAEGNRTRASLNALADANNIEQITKIVNGGLNGFDDRLAQYTAIGLMLAGYAAAAVRAFQTDAKARGYYDGAVDGDPGPKTRAAIHMWLANATGSKVAAAPVVEAKPVAVAPKGAEKVAGTRIMAAAAAASPTLATFGGLDTTTKLIVLGVAFVAVAYLLWRGEVIAARVKSILRSFEGV